MARKERLGFTTRLFDRERRKVREPLLCAQHQRRALPGALRLVLAESLGVEQILGPFHR